MGWRTALVIGAILAVVCVSVGFALDRSAVGTATAPVEMTSCSGEPDAAWPFPFGREVTYAEPPNEIVRSRVREEYVECDQAEGTIQVTDGDEDIWFFAAGVIVVLTIASLPLLHARERRREASP
jgi:hypothetical protein